MKIIICGSMTASKEMIEAENKLKEMGYDVVLPEFTYEYSQMGTEDEICGESVKNKKEYDLIRGYYHKIKEGDAVLVVNVAKRGIDNYIGGNSFLEIGFAHVLDKKIYLLNDLPEVGYRDEIEAMNVVVLNGDVSGLI